MAIANNHILAHPAESFLYVNVNKLHKVKLAAEILPPTPFVQSETLIRYNPLMGTPAH